MWILIILGMLAWLMIAGHWLVLLVLLAIGIGILALIANIWMEVTELPETFWFGFLKGGTVGLAIAAMGFGILYTTGAMKRIADFKMRMLGKGRQAQN